MVIPIVYTPIYHKEKSAMLIPYTFEMEEKVRDKIESFAKEEGRSLASQMRIIMEDWVEKLK